MSFASRNSIGDLRAHSRASSACAQFGQFSRSNQLVTSRALRNSRSQRLSETKGHLFSFSRACVVFLSRVLSLVRARCLYRACVLSLCPTCPPSLSCVRAVCLMHTRCLSHACALSLSCVRAVSLVRARCLSHACALSFVSARSFSYVRK